MCAKGHLKPSIRIWPMLSLLHICLHISKYLQLPQFMLKDFRTKIRCGFKLDLNKFSKFSKITIRSHMIYKWDCKHDPTLRVDVTSWRLSTVHLAKWIPWWFLKPAMCKYPTIVNNSEIYILLPKPCPWMWHLMCGNRVRNGSDRKPKTGKTRSLKLVLLKIL